MSGQLPAYLANRPGHGIAQQAATGVASSQPARISIAGNRYTLIDSLGNARPVNFSLLDPRTQQPVVVQADYLDVVIIGANPAQSKVYFAGQFDPSSSDNVPPTCFSDNGIAPSTQAQVPQSATCAMCPNNAWGSRVNAQTGNQSKACADKKKLAVRLAPYFNDDTIYQLQIPPASLKHMAVYMNYVGSQDYGGRRVDVCDLITRISFESQGVLKFDTAGWYDDAFAAQIEADITGKADKIAWITGINDQPRTAPVVGVSGPPGAAAQLNAGSAPAAAAPQIPYTPGPRQAVAEYPQVAPPQQAQPAAQAFVVPQQGHPNVIPMQPTPQAPAEPKKRRPRAGKGGVTEPQASVLPASPPVQVQPQVAVVVPPTASPAAPAAAPPAFLQPPPVQQPAPAAPQTNFGMQAQPQLASEDVAAKIAAAMAR